MAIPHQVNVVVVDAQSLGRQCCLGWDKKSLKSSPWHRGLWQLECCSGSGLPTDPCRHILQRMLIIALRDTMGLMSPGIEGYWFGW
jgi:hypothetical protein